MFTRASGPSSLSLELAHREEQLRGQKTARGTEKKGRRIFSLSIIMPYTGPSVVAPPPSYDPRHPERDPVGAAAAREAAARASAVRVEKAKVRCCCVFLFISIKEKKSRRRFFRSFFLYLNLFSHKKRQQKKTAPPREAQKVLQGVRRQPPPGLRRARRSVHGCDQGRERDGVDQRSEEMKKKQ